MMEKAVLAWWLRQRTTARRAWICERLSMGEVSAVTRAIRLVKSGQHAKAKQMVNRLMKLSVTKLFGVVKFAELAS
jgi:hypothetical protein